MLQLSYAHLSTGAHVVLPVRNISRAHELFAAFISPATPLVGQVTVFSCDLASLKSIANFVTNFHARFDRLHVLMFAANVPAPDTPPTDTVDQIDRLYAMNFLAPYFLFRLLHPTLGNTGIRSAPTRILTTITCGVDCLLPVDEETAPVSTNFTAKTFPRWTSLHQRDSDVFHSLLFSLDSFSDAFWAVRGDPYDAHLAHASSQLQRAVLATAMQHFIRWDLHNWQDLFQDRMASFAVDVAAAHERAPDRAEQDAQRLFDAATAMTSPYIHDWASVQSHINDGRPPWFALERPMDTLLNDVWTMTQKYIEARTFDALLGEGLDAQGVLPAALPATLRLREARPLSAVLDADDTVVFSFSSLQMRIVSPITCLFDH
jgi:hypothetical protein